MVAEFNHFDDIADRLPTAISRTVRKTAFDVQAAAQAAAPIDTGFLRNSIYTITIGGQGTKRAGQGISSRRKRVKKSLQDQMFPEVAPPPDDTIAYVVVGATYGAYVEFGTRYMPPQPYFYPAFDQVRGAFEDAIARIEEQLGGNATTANDV